MATNLYPPIIRDSLVCTQKMTSLKYYFTMSSLSSISDISNYQIQMIVRNQKDNKNSLNSGSIICLEIFQDTGNNNLYYCEIPTQQFSFLLNNYYKIQLRLSSYIFKLDENTNSYVPSYTDIKEYLDNYSEWSTVGLLYIISNPTLTLTNFASSINNLVNASTKDVIGKVTFDDSDDTETLAKYRVILYDESLNLLEDSGNLISSDNQINYTLISSFENQKSYTLDIELVTKNLYSFTETYNFTTTKFYLSDFDININVEADEEQGAMVVELSLSEGNQSVYSNITIQRCSSETDFVTWEDVHTCIYNSEEAFTWVDRTIKSGIYYRYGVCKRDAYGNRSALAKGKQIVVNNFEDVYLSGSERHLRIRYNSSVSSFKYAVTESKIDTIGSQYPFIIRNGSLQYKQFAIDGLITMYQDKDNLFTVDDYKDYDDFTKEREFRQKVMSFLYDDTIKLYRSGAEGNILIKLMDISLTPNETLGRMVYSFSCTAYEVADSTVENYDYYNIQPIGEIQPITISKSLLGQIYGKYSKGTNLFALIQEKISNEKDIDNYYYELTKLSHIRLDLVADSIDKFISADNCYTITINNEDISVRYQNCYELKNIDITSLILQDDAYIILDYVAEILVQEKEENSFLGGSLYYTYGQLLVNNYRPRDIIEILKDKYACQRGSVTESLYAVSGLRFKGEPGKKITIQDAKDEQTYYLNESGQLTIRDDDLLVKACKVFQDDYYIETVYDEATGESYNQLRTNDLYHYLTDASGNILTTALHKPLILRQGAVNEDSSIMVEYYCTVLREEKV